MVEQNLVSQECCGVPSLLGAHSRICSCVLHLKLNMALKQCVFLIVFHIETLESSIKR